MTARTPSATAAPPTARRSGPVLCLLAVGALSAGVALAGPAAAVDDPSKPDARVTHGPSCRPGGVVVEVTGGTVAYAVTLATTRAPLGEDFAEVGPGVTVVLSTGDADWAETIDGRLEFTALDGSGAAYVDDLDGYTFTRPSAEDCAAIAAPIAATTVPLEPGGDEPADGGAGVLDGPGAAGAAAGRAITPGTASPVDLVEEVAAAPAALATSASVAPMLAAAVALGGAAAGLVRVLGRSRRGSRQPTPSG